MVVVCGRMVLESDFCKLSATFAFTNSATIDTSFDFSNMRHSACSIRLRSPLFSDLHHLAHVRVCARDVPAGERNQPLRQCCPRSPPHPLPLLLHLNIDNISLNSHNNAGLN